MCSSILLGVQAASLFYRSNIILVKQIVRISYRSRDSRIRDPDVRLQRCGVARKFTPFRPVNLAANKKRPGTGMPKLKQGRIHTLRTIRSLGETLIVRRLER